MQVIDFFCGAGGFSEGFRQQGFKIVAGIDNWKPAIDTFNHNFELHCEPRNVLDFERSIKQIEELPDTEIIIGSPPCVSFSSSNRSGKADKSLGLKLIRIFLRIVAVKKYKPNSKLKAWFMENVANSKVHLPSQYSFKQLGLEKWALDYGFNPKSIAITLEGNQIVINSADYGVPQSRVRIFTGELIQSKRSLLLEQTHEAPNQSERLPQHITLEYIRKNLASPSSTKTEENVVDPLYPEIKIRQTMLTDQFYDTGLYVSDWKGSKFLKTNHPYMGPMSFPEREDRPSRTITATKIGNSREAIIFQSEDRRVENGQYRTPTIREAATLMGFPITFQFIGSENNKWTLVGNAVCPPVSRAFAKAIRKAYRLKEIPQPLVSVEISTLESVPNLNTYERKSFDNPPQKKEGTRFRRHPFKHGNITVTLSNYDIETSGKNLGRWHSSIQYGTGAGFPIQSFPDGYFRILEPIIEKFEGGPEFLDIINNGFSKKVAGSKLLQKMYELQRNEGEYVEPVELVENIGELIEVIQMKETNYEQDGATKLLFKKRSIPKKQMMALYAINKICSIANSEEK